MFLSSRDRDVHTQSACIVCLTVAALKTTSIFVGKIKSDEAVGVRLKAQFEKFGPYPFTGGQFRRNLLLRFRARLKKGRAATLFHSPISTCFDVLSRIAFLY